MPPVIQNAELPAIEPVVPPVISGERGGERARVAGERRPSAEGPRPKGGRFRGIEGARGLAALMVFVSHLLWLEPKGLGYFIDLGKMGVVLFFFISGFLVLPSFVARSDLRHFVVTRVFRLYPLYWVSIFLAVVLMAGQVSARDIAANLTMFQQFLLAQNIQTVYWTLTIELIFYIALVATQIAAPRLLRDRLGLAFHGLGVICLVSGAVRCATQVRLPLAIPLALMVMAYGGLARRSPPSSVGSSSAGEASPARSVWLLFYAVTSCIMGYSFVTQFEENPYRYAISYAVAWLLFLAARRDAGWLTSAPLTFVGSVSYGLYLFHAPILERMRLQLGDETWVVAASLLLSLALATAAHYTIELPSIRAGRRFVEG